MHVQDKIYGNAAKYLSQNMKRAESSHVIFTDSKLESQIYDSLLEVGWKEKDLRIGRNGLFLQLKDVKWMPDIELMDGNEIIGGIEIKSDLFALGRIDNWIKVISEVIEEAKIPCLIISTGFYYEAHFTQRSIVKKLDRAPTKEYLLSVIHGEESE